MKDIDATEALIATIGIEPIISKEVERVTLGQLAESNKLAKLIYDEAKAMMNGQESRVPFSAINYKRMLHDLTEEYTETQLRAMVEKFPPMIDKIAANFLVEAKKIVQFLSQLLPKQTKQTLLGPENIPPSMALMHNFAAIFNVLDSPARILGHIAAGSLLKVQAQAVQQLYPTISSAITDALINAGTDAKAAKKSFVVPPKVEIGWLAWKQQPRIDPQLHTRMQMNYQQAQQQKQQPTEQASGGQNSVAAKEALTNTQQALYPEATNKG